MVTDSTTTDSRLRWFHPTPGRLLVILLAAEAILLLSERWFPRGCAVLIAIAVVGLTMLLMFLWWLAALCFRWRFQFSLRSLLILAIAVAIPCSWLAVEMKKAREQREVVEWVHKVGGAVGYDYQQLTGDATPAPTGATDNYEYVVTPPSPPHPEPTWLRRFFDIHFFATVALVIFCNGQATDADLEHIGTLAQLQELHLENAHVTDVGLQHLSLTVYVRF